MPTDRIVDPATIEFTRKLADREAIRAVNPQRYEMEQLDVILSLDPELKIIIGYRDVRPDEFWTRGHMPGNPILPGVLMCEAAAQLCSYYITHQKIMADGHILGFGGMNEMRFRSTVKPGDRLVVIARGERLKRMACLFQVEGYVGDVLAFEGGIMGIALPIGAK